MKVKWNVSKSAVPFLQSSKTCLNFFFDGAEYSINPRKEKGKTNGKRDERGIKVRGLPFDKFDSALFNDQSPSCGVAINALKKLWADTGKEVTQGSRRRRIAVDDAVGSLWLIAYKRRLSNA